MGTYAAQTSVDAGRSRAEIERTLSRYGARAFSYATEDGEHGGCAAVTVGAGAEAPGFSRGRKRPDETLAP